MADVPAEEYVCARIRRAEQALVGHHESILRGYGLTMIQYTVLLGLSRADNMSGAQLARACGVSQQSMSSVLQGMQSKGLIDRQPSAAHSKALLATMTPAANDLLRRAYDEVIVLERALTDQFTPDEHRKFCEFLDRATEVLNSQTTS